LEGDGAANVPRPEGAEPGKLGGRPGVDYASALPVLATVLAIVFFLCHYYATYECKATWGSPYCEKPYFTDLFNSLQARNWPGEKYDLRPLFPGYEAPGPGPERAPVPVPEGIPPLGTVARAVTYERHVEWALFTGLYVLACLAAFGVGAHVIWRAHGSRRAGRAGAFAKALGVAAVGPSLFALALWGDPSDIFTQIVNTTVNRDIFNVIAWEFGLHLVGLFLAVFLSAAASATLARRAARRRKRLSLLAVQYDQLTLILYAATVMLILATLRVNALLHWSLDFLQPAPWLPEADARHALFVYKGVEGLVSNLVTSVGAFGTLLLAAVYVPAALVLSARAARLAPRRPKVPAGPEPHLTGRGLGLAPPLKEQLLQLAVILGPLIAGPLGDWVSRLR